MPTSRTRIDHHHRPRLPQIRKHHHLVCLQGLALHLLEATLAQCQVRRGTVCDQLLGAGRPLHRAAHHRLAAVEDHLWEDIPHE